MVRFKEIIDGPGIVKTVLRRGIADLYNEKEPGSPQRVQLDHYVVFPL